MFYRIVFTFIFGFFLVTSGSASMVSFFILESGLPENAAVNQHSQQWENALMDVFFDAGYIVSNAPISRIESKPAGDILSAACDLEDARNWGIDFILITLLDYNNELFIPDEISFLIFKVTTNERVFERQIKGRAYRSVREEHDDIRAIIRGLVPYIK